MSSCIHWDIIQWFEVQILLIRTSPEDFNDSIRNYPDFNNSQFAKFYTPPGLMYMYACFASTRTNAKPRRARSASSLTRSSARRWRRQRWTTSPGRSAGLSWRRSATIRPRTTVDRFGYADPLSILLEHFLEPEHLYKLQISFLISFSLRTTWLNFLWTLYGMVGNLMNSVRHGWSLLISVHELYIFN